MRNSRPLDFLSIQDFFTVSDRFFTPSVIVYDTDRDQILLPVADLPKFLCHLTLKNEQRFTNFLMTPAPNTELEPQKQRLPPTIQRTSEVEGTQ